MLGSPEVAATRWETDRARVAVGCSTIAVAGALAIESLGSPAVGAALCGALVAALLNCHLWSISRGSRSDGAFLALALVPLGGLLAVVMPTRLISSAAWPLLASVPLLLAVDLAARRLRDESAARMLRPSVVQLCLVPAGLPLGLLAYDILRPTPLGHGSRIAVAVAALIVLATTEELLFRGLLQPVLCRFYGVAGIGLTSGLSALVAMAAHSLAYGVFAGLVACGFGVVSRRTGSVAGTSLTRAILLVGLLVVWPRILG